MTSDLPDICLILYVKVWAKLYAERGRTWAVVIIIITDVKHALDGIEIDHSTRTQPNFKILVRGAFWPIIEDGDSTAVN